MRSACYAAAAAVFAWEVVATALWLRAGGGVGSFVRAATSDWMALLWFTDMAVFSLACVAWVAVDASRRGRRPLPWALGTLVLGSPVLFLYLARRGADVPIGLER